MTNDVLATKVFVAKSGDEEYKITLHLVPHGGFDYGNRHALLYNVQDLKKGKQFVEEGFDARYDSRFNTVESFNQNAYGFVKDQIRDEFTLEEVIEDE